MSTDQPRLLSFTISDWPVLGGPVSLSLFDGVSVLVGRNGAGKSAIVEGFQAIANIATNRFSRIRGRSENFPKTLVVDILTPKNRHLRYEYHLLTIPMGKSSGLELNDIDSDEDNEAQFSWNDSCQYLDKDKELLWKTEAGETILYSKENKPFVAILGSFNLLSRFRFPNSKQKIDLPIEMEWFYHILNGCQILNKQATRRSSVRRGSLLKKAGSRVFSNSDELPDAITRKIIRLNEDEFDELTQILKRIGVAKEVDVKKFVADPPAENRKDEHVFEVLLDRTNIGFLSDGTLRILSVLVDIIRPSSFTTTIVEEPEQQIHPSLLSKLLREIQSYTSDENLIISTHSPQVVSEMRPDQIHLVQRVNGCTTVRKLNESEIDNVYTYLTEEGDLGEWVYSGILDDE